MLIVTDLNLSTADFHKGKSLPSLFNVSDGFMSREPASPHKPHARPGSQGVLVFGGCLPVVEHHCRVDHIARRHGVRHCSMV